MHTPTSELIFNDSPKLEITPNTKSYVSELTQLPSPIKKPKIINSLTSPTKIIKRNLILQEKLNNLRRQLKRKRSIIQYLKKQNNKNISKNIDIQKFFNQSQFPSINSRALMTMQMLHKNRKPWTKTEKKLALSIYYKSPSTYKYMRKQGVVLPGESTVRRWLKSIEYTPGFINDYLNEIKTKVSAMLYSVY